MISALWQILFPSEYFRLRRKEAPSSAAILGLLLGLVVVIAPYAWFALAWYASILSRSLMYGPFGRGIGMVIPSVTPGMVWSHHWPDILKGLAVWLGCLAVPAAVVYGITLYWVRAKPAVRERPVWAWRTMKLLLLDGLGLIWFGPLLAGLLYVNVQRIRVAVDTNLALATVMTVGPVFLLLCYVTAIMKSASGAIVACQDDRMCRNCGYLLLNLPETTTRCPECGEVFDPQRIRKAQEQVANLAEGLAEERTRS